MRTHKPSIILLWGPPAAGKSTLASNLVTAYGNRFQSQLCHLGTDRLNFSILGNHFDPTIRDSLYESILNLTENLIRKGKSVLIEGTFVHRRWRSRVDRIAEQFQANQLTVLTKCRLSLALERNSKRSGIHRVPEKFLIEAHRLADEPESGTDFVFDSELIKPEGLSVFLLGALRAC